MDRRLLLLSAVVVAAACAPVVSLTELLLAILLPLAGVAGAAAAGPFLGLLVLAPAAGALAVLAPENLWPFAASGLAGWLMGTMIRTGQSPARALALGAVPIAAWTIGLAMSGFDPIPPEAAAALQRILTNDATRGTSVPVITSPELVIDVMRRTWVGAEILIAVCALAFAYRLAMRLFADRGWPAFPTFDRFDVHDAFVLPLIAGLAAIFAMQNGAPDVFASVGGNLLMGTGALYALRGFAIQYFWLRRAGIGAVMCGATLAVIGLIFLPVFPFASAALGLLDTWFDFRRVRGLERGRHPLSFRHSSSDDGS